jgi:hypothetical protein
MKLIRKERNIVYEYYEVELTEEQVELYKNDREKFLDDFIWSEKIPFGDSVNTSYIDTTDLTHYLESEDEPEF